MLVRWKDDVGCVAIPPSRSARDRTTTGSARSPSSQPLSVRSIRWRSSLRACRHRCLVIISLPATAPIWVLHTSRGRSAVLCCAIESDGLEAIRVVRSDRTADYEQKRLTRRGDPDSGLASDWEQVDVRSSSNGHGRSVTHSSWGEYIDCIRGHWVSNLCLAE